VEREDRNVRTYVPTGYLEGHKLRSSFLPIEAGSFALFSVPRQHLAENLLIRTDFLYSWEDYEVIPEDVPSAPRYTVAFRSSDMPKFYYEAMNNKSRDFKKVIRKTGLVRPRVYSKKYSTKQN
jgi:hypothetical protein